VGRYGVVRVPIRYDEVWAYLHKYISSMYFSLLTITSNLVTNVKFDVRDYPIGACKTTGEIDTSFCEPSDAIAQQQRADTRWG